MQREMDEHSMLISWQLVCSQLCHLLNSKKVLRSELQSMGLRSAMKLIDSTTGLTLCNLFANCRTMANLEEQFRLWLLKFHVRDNLMIARNFLLAQHSALSSKLQYSDKNSYGMTNTKDTKPRPSVLPFSRLKKICVKEMIVGVNEGTYIEGVLSEHPYAVLSVMNLFQDSSGMLLLFTDFFINC
jgi:hypothetical protein